MALSQQFLDELKSANEITSVISSYITLKRSSRNMVGLCPFHSEKSPSFTVFADTQSYYCFGCGAGGDVITFIKNVENLEYIEAVTELFEMVQFLAKPTKPPVTLDELPLTPSQLCCALQTDDTAPSNKQLSMVVSMALPTKPPV